MHKFVKVSMKHLPLLLLMLLPCFTRAQQSPNDTIRLGGIEMNGHTYPCYFLPDIEITAMMLYPEDRERINKLRSDVFAVYYYANSAAALFKTINATLDTLPDKHARKQYLKTMDRQLDALLKKPLKNLSVDQGHVLIRLINRQTGSNCYHIIRELKGGLSAVMWQSVGVVFNNNLARAYDPTGRDQELEFVVQELESSVRYRYQLYMQDELMRRIGKK
ncbi:MAG: DUF4294 domain-containing protein [Chitinophagia bacterium]|nr:DUF4294 domain-containing protein [Chitinophagia bacterium]